MLRIMLVDDEPFALERVVQIIQTADFAQELTIYTAVNGKDALQQALNIDLDILLTDVKMPGIDGIELAERIKVLSPNCHIIFLSNYSDKEYLRSAIHLRALEYIDKQVEAAHLLAMIRKAMDEITRFRLQQEKLERFERHFEEAKDILGRFLTKMFRNGESSFSTLANACKRYGMEYLFDSAFRCIIFSTDMISSFQMPVLPKDVFALPAEIHHERDVVLFCYSPQEDALNNSFVRTFYKDVSKIVKVDGMAAGEVVPSYQEANRAYKSAMLHFDRLYFWDKPTLILPGDHVQSDAFSFEDERCKFLFKAVSDLNLKESQNLCCELFATLMAHNATPVQAIRGFAADFGSHLLRVSSHNFLDFHKNHIERDMYQAIWRTRNLSELRTLLYGWIQEMLQCEYGDERIVRMVIAFIRQHHGEADLNLYSITRFTGYSSSYLCTMFKKTVGITINRYITKVRIEKACTLIEKTDESLESIAVRVGYVNVKYFSRVFKRYMLVTPSEYRATHKQG